LINGDKLEINKLRCIRNQQILFSDISFQLNENEILQIQGENGCGKSSLLQCIAGLSTPAAGEIKNIPDFHYIGHTNGIKSSLTVIENLKLCCHLLSTPFDIEKIPQILKLDNLQNTFAKNLSAGQKRKVAIAKLFLIPKKLWLLDEPLTSLDAETQTFFLSALKQHLQQGGMAIVTTHQSLVLDNLPIKTLRLTSC